MDVGNPLLIVSFGESVLGNQTVSQGSDDSQWYFKREVPFE